MSLLTICQNAASEAGFPRPSTIISNTDKTAIQLLALAKRAGYELSKAKNWQRLVKEHTFALATADQDYALPADFRWIVPMTTYDRDNNRIVLNPISGQEWQYLKAWTSIAGLTRRARIRLNQLEFEATIAAADNNKTIAYEYLSTYWVDIAATGTPKAAFTLDTDVTLLDEDLLTMGLVWRFRRAKGLDYESELADYTSQLNISKASDGGFRTLNIGGHDFRSAPNPNIPDAGFG